MLSRDEHLAIFKYRYSADLPHVAKAIIADELNTNSSPEFHDYARNVLRGERDYNKDTKTRKKALRLNIAGLIQIYIDQSGYPKRVTEYESSVYNRVVPYFNSVEDYAKLDGKDYTASNIKKIYNDHRKDAKEFGNYYKMYLDDPSNIEEEHLIIMEEYQGRLESLTEFIFSASLDKLSHTLKQKP